MKVTEFQLKPRPYNDDAARELLAPVIDAETADWHYNVHHKGYVDKLNEIEKSLPDADPTKSNGNYSQFGELKRRWTWNHSGMVLHDVYWENLGGDGDIQNGGVDIMGQITKDFGSFDAWKTDFKATALAAKLSGWGLLVFDMLGSGILKNVLVDEHHYGAVWGAIPLIACDVFEHAYYHKDGPKRAAYIDNFINNLNWMRVNERFIKYVAR